MKIKKNLIIEDFIHMEELEKMYYDEEFIAPYEEAYEWYKSKEYSVIVVEDNHKIVGFMNIFPIKKWVFNELKKGTFNDKYLTPNEIIDFNTCEGGIYNLFLSCVVIHSDYRKSEALNMILKAYAQYYSDIRKDIELQYIITDNVTKEGERFSERLGFSKVIDSEHESVVYMGKVGDFIKKFR